MNMYHKKVSEVVILRPACDMCIRCFRCVLKAGLFTSSSRIDSIVSGRPVEAASVFDEACVSESDTGGVMGSYGWINNLRLAEAGGDLARAAVGYWGESG